MGKNHFSKEVEIRLKDILVVKILLNIFLIFYLLK